MQLTPLNMQQLNQPTMLNMATYGTSTWNKKCNLLMNTISPGRIFCWIACFYMIKLQLNSTTHNKYEVVSHFI